MKSFVKCYAGEDIDRLYRKITEDIVLDGKDITFGYEGNPKKARDIFAVVHIYGKAIKDVLAGKTPMNFRWSGDKIIDYQKCFLVPLDEIGVKKGDETDFEYTYIELLRKFKTPDGDVDQMDISRQKLIESIKTGIQSNQNVGVLYNPLYWDSHNPPCFNWYQVRVMEDKKVSLRLLFRSHDYGDAIWANLCGISKAFNELVIKPAGCELEEIILTSSSAHIHENEADLAKQVCGYDWDFDANCIKRLMGHQGAIP